jgi:hypothetical protein
VRDGGIWFVAGDDKPDQILTNFTARISKNQMLDDGVETQHRYEITATVDGKQRVIQMPAGKYSEMGWVAEQLGAKAVLKAGYGFKDKVREAIQTLEIDTCVDETIYTHTGWRLIDDRWVYLHAGGAIGAEGNICDVTTKLHGALGRYQLRLPCDGTAEQKAIRASLGIIELGPTTITYPLLAGVYRSVMGDTGMSVHLVGGTGVFKTQLAALCQQHYGAEFTGEQLPGSWSSTANALEAETFLAKDALFVIDDFKPTGNRYAVDKLHSDADRILRGSSNGQSRARLNRDAELKPDKPPRTLIMSTGEDTPRGESLRARLLIIQIAKGVINSTRLSRCQQDAAGGLYSNSMSGFIRWVAGDYEAILARLAARQKELRDQLKVGKHQRTANNLAKLIAGFEIFLDYAVSAGAMNNAAAENHREACKVSLLQLAEEQDLQQQEYNPAIRFCDLLRSAINSDQAHLKDRHGGAPLEPLSWGWREDVNTTHGTLRACGVCVGWLDRGNIYLDLNSAIAAVQKVAADNEGIGFTPGRITGALYEADLLASTDIGTSRKTHLVRKTVAGRRTNVLHLKADALGVVLGGLRLGQEEHEEAIAGRIQPLENGA